MNKSLVALAFGTLGLGTAEFVTMGVLPELAQSLEISHAQAGHFISAYALGVCIGAPLCALLAGARPLKHILIGLMAIVAIGNLCSSLSSQYGMLLVSRLIAGLPHGAFFGVGSIVAEKLAEKGKEEDKVAKDTGTAISPQVSQKAESEAAGACESQGYQAAEEAAYSKGKC